MNTVTDPAQFVPYFYISIGETGAYFTLWMADMELVCSKYDRRYVLRHNYYFNLSQDAHEAYEKALKVAHDQGYRLDARVEIMQQEMREIKRLSQEQLTARAEKARAKIEEQLAYEASVRAEKIAMIEAGTYPFGRYYNQPFDIAPVSYITWLIDNVAEFEADSIIQLTAMAVAQRCAHLALPKPDKNMVIGTVGKRDIFDVVIVRKTGCATAYGWCNIITMVDKSGACLVSMGSFCAEVGQAMKIKATVKKHDQYKDQMQTKIQRVVIA